MSSNRSLFLGRLQVFGCLALVCFLAYCFHFNADLTDEGFYLYHFQMGSKAVSFNFYHILISPIGMMFDHALIGYRYLTLITISISAFALSTTFDRDTDRSTKTLCLCLGLLYFSLISTFSYNSLVLVCSCLILCFQHLEYRNKNYIIYSFFTGFICYLIFSARFGSGLFVLMISVLADFFFSADVKAALRKSITRILFFLFCVLATYFLWESGFSQMKEILPVVSKSTHNGLLNKYISDLIRFLVRSVFPPIVLILFSRRFLASKSFLLLSLYCSWFVVSHIILKFDYPRFGYYLSGFLVALSIIECAILFKEIKNSLITFLVFPILTYFSSCLGTNNNLFKSCTYNALLLFPVVYYFYRKLDFIKQTIVLGLVFGVSSYAIYQKQYLQTYRSLPRAEQEFVTSKFEPLKFIKIDSGLEKKLSDIYHKIKKQGEFEDAAIVTFPNLPGIPAFLKINSLGNPWNVDNYANFVLINCTYIKNEKFRNKVFVYSEKKIPPEMMDCIQNKTDKIFVL